MTELSKNLEFKTWSFKQNSLKNMEFRTKFTKKDRILNNFDIYSSSISN